MSEFHLLRPLWLFGALPAALLAWALWSAEDAGRAWRRLVAPHLLGRLLVGREERRRFRPVASLIIAWVATVLCPSGEPHLQ